MSCVILRCAQPTESRAVAAWIAERHYRGCVPAGYGAALEFLERRERVGAMLLGRPTGPGLDARVWAELTRMYFVDEMPLNTESRGLAQMRAWVRKWWPRIRCLIAYSDPEQGHEGKVYEADGWAPFGFTSSGGNGWGSRPGRRDEGKPRTRKQRWVRTP